MRVLVVEDEPFMAEAIRDGLRLAAIAADIAGDGNSALELLSLNTYDIAVLDRDIPGPNGDVIAERIVASGSGTRILVLTTFDLDEYVYGAIRAGASGFLLKDVRPGELVDAIRVVASGNALLGPSAVERLLRRFSVPVDNRRIDSAAVGSLTDREAETLRLLAKGLSNAEIAATLVVSETTVKTHVSNLLRKLGVRDRVQAVIAAYDAGVVQPRRP